VIEKVAKISGKSVGWFYFGEIEEYIADYLTFTGQGELVKEYPDMVKQIKKNSLQVILKIPTGKMKSIIQQRSSSMIVLQIFLQVF